MSGAQGAVRIAYRHSSGTSVSGLNIGRAILRGEKGHLAMPDSAMTRQHWNPFYRYMEDRILEFLNGVVSRTQ